MKKLIAAILALVFLAGCSKILSAVSEVGGQKPDLGVDVPFEGAETESAETEESEPEILSFNKSDGGGPNPYEDYSERRDYWRYHLFEIFRGAEPVDFDDALNYVRDYACTIAYGEEDRPDGIHEYRCSADVPQTTKKEPWAERINTYYQDILSECIAEGDDIWSEYFDDWYVQKFGYYYENAYKLENVITVVRSREFYGSRPSIGWEPFADMFSALDGQKLCLDDLFCVSRDEYLPALLTELADAMASQGVMSVYPGNVSGAIEQLEKASVAAAPVGLVFIFSTGVVDCMAAGVVFLSIPYEKLRGLLNPVYFPDCTN